MFFRKLKVLKAFVKLNTEVQPCEKQCACCSATTTTTTTMEKGLGSGGQWRGWGGVGKETKRKGSAQEKGKGTAQKIHPIAETSGK